jgi:hypothetical protein
MIATQYRGRNRGLKILATLLLAAAIGAGAVSRGGQFTADDLRSVVHAAAENTSTLATMTGDAPISKP